MTNLITTASPSFCSRVTSIALLPVKVVTFPCVYVARKVKDLAHFLFFTKFVGYFVHLGVFSYPSWENSFIKRKFIDFFNHGPRGLVCCPYDQKRINHAIAKLKEIGEVKKINSPVGTLDAMKFTYTDLKAKIEANGGKVLEHIKIDQIKTIKEGKHAYTTCVQSNTGNEFANVFIPDSDVNKWKNFCSKTLNHLGLERVKITLIDGQVVEGFIAWTGRNENSKKRQCFIRFNSPGERFASAKRDIMRRLFGGQDVICFDPPGSGDSEKTMTPSEGAYYIAAEAVLNEAKKDYKAEDIWLDGFCLGGAVATYLWCQHQSEGINFFGQNNFDKMENTFRQQVFPANHLAPHSIHVLKEPRLKVVQNGFDSLQRLHNLKVQGKKGKVVLVNIDNDKSINPKSQELLSAAFSSLAQKVVPIMRLHANPKLDGHREDILSDRETFQRAWSVITA